VRILFAGATGVLGRATLPQLRGHDVIGLTRSPERVQLLRELGAEGVVCDVYDRDALLALAQRVRPETVVNFLTDLSARSVAANNRVRREGGANLLDAAEAAGASRLVVESVAFALDGDGAAALAQLEQTAAAFPADALVLRFGRFWGPGTFHEAPPSPPAVHVDRAGAEAARLLVHASPGLYDIVDDATGGSGSPGYRPTER
jgi:nucleoside-diphosphate-sugar epimerase